MKYILGLGNPGSEYVGTRHNVGRELVEKFALLRNQSDWHKDKIANASLLSGEVVGTPFTLILPETFMNNSGEVVRYFMRENEAKPEDFLVVYDDVDLALGEIKISTGKSSGGHNGIGSIEQAFGSRDFARLRIGISPTSFWTGKMKRPTGAKAMSDFVLGRVSAREQSVLIQLEEKIEKIISSWIESGVVMTMNKYNR